MSINTAELIGEREAAVTARISTSTLARFAEAGYFQVVLMGEERCYPKQALSSLFGVTFEQAEAIQTPPKRGNVITFPHPESLAAKPIHSDSEPVAEPVSQSPIAEGEPENSAISELHDQESPIANTSDAVESVTIPNTTSFNSILKMHADILDRQEREILDLRSEREWLKKRIEKLEEKAERDQILLLSEAQTVKQLIQIYSQKKSIVRQSLEWLGVIPQELPEHDTLIAGKTIGSDPGSPSDRTKE